MMQLMNRVLQDNERPFPVLSLICSNYQLASERMHRPNLGKLFSLLSRSFEIQAMNVSVEDEKRPVFNRFLERMQESIQDDLKNNYAAGEKAAHAVRNRGVLRSVTWGKKVAAIQNSVIKRYIKSEGSLVQHDQQMYVCQACGFIGIGTETPDVCPVCKAPAIKFISLS